MLPWLTPAITYLPKWLEFKIAQASLPGGSIAISHSGIIVLTHTVGVANVATGERLVPTHRFRVASHSKTFTAAAVMKLLDAGRLRLDDRAGTYVDGLHESVASATVAQLLSHTTGIIKDDEDAGWWNDTRPFPNTEELRQVLAARPVIPANTRMKYSNAGFGLVGLIIESVTGEPYSAWITREIIAPFGLSHTTPDWPLPPDTLFACGHTTRGLLGAPLVVPADNPTHALAPATGFIATPSDLVRFFSSLDPAAGNSVLSVEVRREMTRRHWRVPDITAPRYYGLGLMQGDSGGWAWFGHSGGFQGVKSFTAVASEPSISVSIAVNSLDVDPVELTDRALRILQTFASRGPPTKENTHWAGRYWTIWGAIDLVPMGDKILAATPASGDPFADAVELTITGPDTAHITRASGFSSFGQSAKLVRDAAGQITEVTLGGVRMLPQAVAANEAQARYGSSHD